MNDARRFQQWFNESQSNPQFNFRPGDAALAFNARRLPVEGTERSADASEDWLFPDGSTVRVDNPRQECFEAQVSL